MQALKRLVKWPLRKVYRALAKPVLTRCVKRELDAEMQRTRQELDQAKQELATASAELTRLRQDAEVRRALESPRMLVLQDEMRAELARMDRAYLTYFADLTQRLTDEVAALAKKVEGAAGEPPARGTSSCAA
jgi:hypothetical protein